MSTHKSLWKCICVVENGTTSSFHILNNAGRLVRPFQKQKPRNLHYLINKFQTITEEADNEQKTEEIVPNNSIELQTEKPVDPLIKLPLLPFPEDLPPLSSLVAPPQPIEQSLPPKLKFFSLQIPIAQPDLQELAQPR